MNTINMLSKADSIKGQGVLSAHDEQVRLVKEELADCFAVYENKLGLCDINHYHTINPSFYIGLPFAKLFGTTVGYVHFLPETLEDSIHLPKLFQKVFYKYMISFYKSMDYLVTVNGCFIERMAQYGIDKSKVVYIPNFVSEKNFYKIEDKKAIRKKWMMNEKDFIVLCVGQLQIRKGILDFIETAKKMPEVKFVWAGAFAFGKISSGYEQIKKVVENPPENVTFLGLVERECMNELYNLADVMFLPSFEELFPMTILESMNCSVPILLRDLTLYDDILFDFYLSGKTIDDFVSMIQRLKSDSDFYEAAARRSHKGHCFYSKEHVTMLWRNFYESIVLEKQKSSITNLIHSFAWKKN